MLSLLTMVGRLISTENPVVCIHFLFPLSIISLIFSVHQFGKGGNAIFTLGSHYSGEMTVYAYLIFCEDRKTHQCWPSIGRISQHTGMSANTVAKYIRQLEERQLINVEPTKVRTERGEVRNGTLQFTIRPIQEAVNYKLERDLASLPEQKHTRKRR